MCPHQPRLVVVVVVEVEVVRCLFQSATRIRCRGWRLNSRSRSSRAVRVVVVLLLCNTAGTSVFTLVRPPEEHTVI